MDLCGTPAFTGSQFDDCPLSITGWNLLLRKPLINECYALSKAFDISTNTPRTSRVVHIDIWINLFVS